MSKWRSSDPENHGNISHCALLRIHCVRNPRNDADVPDSATFSRILVLRHPPTCPEQNWEGHGSSRVIDLHVRLRHNVCRERIFMDLLWICVRIQRLDSSP